MKFRVVYPLYVWLAGVFIGSVINYWGYFLFVNDSLITTKSFMEALSTFPLSIWIVLVISFPSYLLLWLISYLISTITSLSTLKIKGLVAASTFVLCALTFIYFGALDDPASLNIFLCFAVPLIGSAYCFKVKDEVSSGSL